MLMNPGLKTGVAWGTASEFDKKNEREKIVRQLTTQFDNSRVKALPIENQTHAMNLDPFLNSTIIVQLMKQLSEAKILD
jgi:hypothetical protein